MVRSKIHEIRKKRQRRGFNLVEVTLALAIASFGMVSIFGLLPVGLASVKKATESTILAQITQKITSEIHLLGITNLQKYANEGPYYFTNDGTQQSESTQDTRYYVNLTLGNAKYPGSDKVAQLSNNMKNVIITIEKKSNDIIVTSDETAIWIPNYGN